MAGVQVQLINGDGDVVDSTTTGRDGRYRFTSFDETGNYQVQILLPTCATARTTTQDVSISRGDVTINNVSFAVKMGGSSQQPHGPTKPMQPAHRAAFDVAFMQLQESSLNATTGPQALKPHFLRSNAWHG